MESNYSRKSLFADVMSGAKTGAAIGRSMTGLVGAATGGLAGAAIGCLCGIVIKPLKRWIAFAENK